MQPDRMNQLAGNHSLKEQLAHRMGMGQLSHAYILSGPEGCGKHTLAGILAGALVCRQPNAPCGACSDCKKAAAGIHPDVITLAPAGEGKGITVDQVRQLRTDAYVRPNEALRKVYILDCADTLNANGQNAMLKLLEEGPSYACFLLLAQNASALLPTVRSRCEELALAPVTVPQAEQWLARRFPDQSEGERRRAALDCQGILGRAVKQLSGQGGEDLEQQKLVRDLAEAWLEGKESRLMELCVPMEKWDRQRFTAFLDALTVYLSALLVRHPDRRRVLDGVELAAELRQAAALNVNPGHLAGWLCAASLR